jgi:hypothetical protein
MDLNLGGKVALVTGGCSGIGRAIACALLQTGCEVHIGDLDQKAGCDCPSSTATTRSSFGSTSPTPLRCRTPSMPSSRRADGSTFSSTAPRSSR